MGMTVKDRGYTHRALCTGTQRARSGYATVAEDRFGLCSGLPASAWRERPGRGSHLADQTGAARPTRQPGAGHARRGPAASNLRDGSLTDLNRHNAKLVLPRVKHTTGHR